MEKSKQQLAFGTGMLLFLISLIILCIAYLNQELGIFILGIIINMLSYLFVSVTLCLYLKLI